MGQHKVVDYHLLPCLSFEFLHGDPKYIWRLPAPDGGSPNSGRRAKNEGGQAASQQGSRNFGHATNVQPGTWPTVIKSAHSGLEMPFDLRKLLQVYSRTAALVNICT